MAAPAHKNVSNPPGQIVNTDGLIPYIKSCAQCGKLHTPSKENVGCPKCARGIHVSEIEFRQPLKRNV